MKPIRVGTISLISAVLIIAVILLFGLFYNIIEFVKIDSLKSIRDNFLDNHGNFIGIPFDVLIVIGILSGTIGLFGEGRSKKYSLISILIISFIVGLIATTYSLYHRHRFVLKDYGIYEVLEMTETSWKIKSIKKTDTIPAILNSDFGFTWVPKGFYGRIFIPIKEIVVFPSPGMWDTVSKSFKAEEISNSNFHIGRMGSVVYQFGNKNTLVPGTWSLQLWYNNKKVIEKKFYVFLP